jgi:hypothetical protein
MPVVKREPGCFQATPAAFPEYFGEALPALVQQGPCPVLKSADPRIGP